MMWCCWPPRTSLGAASVSVRCAHLRIELNISGGGSVELTGRYLLASFAAPLILREGGGRRQGSPLRCGQGRVAFRFVRLDEVHEQIEFVAFRGASRSVKDLINAVHCRLIVCICSNQLREHGRSKEKGGGRWSGGRPVLPRAYYARAPGVGLLGWSKGAGDDKGRVYDVVKGGSRSAKGRAPFVLRTFPPCFVRSWAGANIKTPPLWVPAFAGMTGCSPSP